MLTEPRRDPHEFDYYADGAWYDAEYVHIGRDIPYYVDVAARTPGPILELACGTGRITFPMISAGAVVHGIDNAPAMLAQAEKKRRRLPAGDQARVSFSAGDMRTLRLHRRFDAVILAFNTLMHMTEDADLRSALETARAHLSPSGRFYFDIHTPLPSTGSESDPEGRYDPQEMIEARTGHRYVVSENNVYLPRQQINLMRFYYQRVDRNGAPVGPERRSVLRLRVIFPRELDHWLRLVGLEIVEDWDDFERSGPFTAKGGRRVVVARIQPGSL